MKTGGLLIGLLLLVSACTGPPDDTIRFGLASGPVNLDPRYATDATSVRINRLIYQRLVDFDEQSRPVPALATWDKISRYTIASISNRAGQPFTTGRP